MRIQDRTSNRVIVDVHPLIAQEALARSNGDKTRVVANDPFAVLIVNSFWAGIDIHSAL